MATNYLNKNLKDSELLDIVDKTGTVIEQATRDQICKKGFLHPAVNVIVLNGLGQIFIQRRSPKKAFPLYWDISAAEHVKTGENYRSAAIRGLKEELSIKGKVKILRKKHIQRNEYVDKGIHLIDFELVVLFCIIYTGKIKIDNNEVIEGKFISLKELDKLIRTKQIIFTPWGLDEINYLITNPKVIAELRH